MNKKIATIILLVIFLLAFSTRIYFSLQSEQFSNPESYYHLRQADHIATTGHPLLHDELSYGGRTHSILPAFHYLLAGIRSLTTNTLPIKVLIALLGASVAPLTYMLSKEITKKRKASLYAAFIASFIPIHFATTTNEVMPIILFIPLFLLLITSFLRLGTRTGGTLFVVTLIILTLTHPLTLLFIAGLIIYYTLLYFEHLNTKTRELEFGLLSIFFVTWGLLLLYRSILLTHGINALTTNIPEGYLSFALQGLTIPQALYSIGIIPFIIGIIITYQYFFQEKKQSVYLIIGLLIATTTLLFLTIHSTTEGLIILGILFSVLFAEGYCWLTRYSRTTRFNTYKRLAKVGLFLVILLTGVISSMVSANVLLSTTLSDDQHAVLTSLQTRTTTNTTILALVEEGHYISAIAQRKNVMDTKFLLITDVQERYQDHQTMLRTKSQITSLQLLTEYDVHYIYYSKQAREQLNSTQLAYLSAPCFTLLTETENASVYSRNTACEVNVIET